MSGGFAKESRSFSEYLNLAGEELSAFDKRLQPWMDAVGVENMNVRVYEIAKQRAGGIVGDFFKVVGLSDTYPHLEQFNESANLSFGRNWIEIIRLFNKVNQSNKAYRENLTGFVAALETIGLPHDHANFLSDESRQLVIDRWRPHGTQLVEWGLITEDDLAALTWHSTQDGEWAPLTQIPTVALDLLFLYSKDPSDQRQLQRTIAELKSEKKSLHRENRSLRRQIARMERSRSWRYTKLLRKLV